MPYHVLGDIHRDELIAIVHRDRHTYEFRRNGGSTRPGLDHVLLARALGIHHALLELVMNEGWFLE